MRGWGRSVRKANPVLPVSSTKIDVPLRDPVRRIERERGLVVLAGLAELTELPERLREPVLRLGVGAELEQPAVRLGCLRPLGRRGLRNRLVDELSLEADLVDGGRRLRLEFGEGH